MIRLKNIFQKLFILLLFFIVSKNFLFSQNNVSFSYQGFSGGMMLHSGYLSGSEINIYNNNILIENVKIKGLPFGIGGMARFHFGDNFRVGVEGYGSSLNYGDFKSNFSIGWGGILADYYTSFNKWKFFIGTTVGGGSVKNLTLLENTPLDFETENNSSYRKYSMIVLDPFVGIEYSVTEKLNLIFKTDYLLNISNTKSDYVTGIRCYLGVLFYRLKKINK